MERRLGWRSRMHSSNLGKSSTDEEHAVLHAISSMASAFFSSSSPKVSFHAWLFCMYAIVWAQPFLGHCSAGGKGGQGRETKSQDAFRRQAGRQTRQHREPSRTEIEEGRGKMRGRREIHRVALLEELIPPACLLWLKRITVVLLRTGEGEQGETGGRFASGQSRGRLRFLGRNVCGWRDERV